MRTAVITGGASGLGAVTAVKLRDEGLKVVTLDIGGGRRPRQRGRHRRPE